MKTAFSCSTKPSTDGNTGRLLHSVFLSRLHQGGEWCSLAWLPLLLQGVQEAQRSRSPHSHPHPREAFQVQTVLQSFCCQEYPHGTYENAHGYQGLWVSVLSEVLLHFWQHEGTHASAYRWEAGPLHETVTFKGKVKLTFEHTFFTLLVCPSCHIIHLLHSILYANIISMCIS